MTKKLTIFVSAWSLVVLSTTLAAEYGANEVEAIDGKVQCFSRSDWFVTVVSGPCNGFIAPKKIAIGETFAADGKDREIKVIVATEAERDMKGYGLDIRKGEWTCIAGETKRDLDLEKNNNARWLYVPNCKLIRK
jgi:hypothetical protein